MSASARKPVSPEIELSGLDHFTVSELMTVGAPPDNNSGKPLELRLEEVIEDAQQVRSEDNPGFRAESLAELAASIIESGGLKTPISVRSRNAEGFFVVNHGARRLRASRMAGLATIRAFVDDNHDEYDQAIENIQRESFTPMEIARFIERREQRGETRSAIAKRLGKSNAFVTQHASLLKLPGDLRDAYDDGRCRDVLTLYELAKFSKQYPDAVGDFVRATPEITRAAAEAFRQGVKAPTHDVRPATTEAAEASRQIRASRATPRPKLLILVRFEGALYALRADLLPSSPQRGWIDQPGRDPTEVSLTDVQLDSIVSS